MQKCVLRCVAVMASVRVLKVLKNGILGKMGAEVFDFRDKNEYLCSAFSNISKGKCDGELSI